MDATTIEHQQPPARNVGRRVGYLACAVLALILTSASLGALVQHAFINNRHAPALIKPARAPHDAQLERCGSTQPDTRIVTLPYRYPNSPCPSRVVLDRSVHLRPVPRTEVQA
jgi:hypothetical protein